MEIPSPTPERTPAESESSLTNPWFAVTLGLLGLMFGYGVALYEVPPAQALIPPRLVQAGNPAPTPIPSAPLPVARQPGCGIN